MRDLAHNILPSVLVAPAAKTATLTLSSSNSIDKVGYDSVTFLWVTGAYTDGTFTPAVYESDDNTTFTAAAAGDVISNISAVSSSAGQNKVQWAGYKGSKRYCALQVTASGTTTGMIYGILGVKGHAESAPTF